MNDQKFDQRGTYRVIAPLPVMERISIKDIARKMFMFSSQEYIMLRSTSKGIITVPAFINRN